MINFMNYNIKIDSALSFDWNKNSTYARARKYDALSFRIKGDAFYQHGDENYTVQKHDILFVPAHYDYTLTANKEEVVYVIHFFIENSNFDKLHIFRPLNPDVFTRLFMEMITIWNIKPVGYQAKLTSLFYEVVAQIEIQEHKKIFTHNANKIQEVLEYIHKNFNNGEINIDSIAKYAKCSTVYLRKLFKATLKTTPSQYLYRLRMDHAVGLLKSGYYTIEEIAFQSGFNNANYFSQLYKKEYGILPSKKLKKAYQRVRIKKF